MNKPDIEKHIPVIGLEIHVQLSTNTKMFSPEKYEYGNLPNNNVSNITLAHPGTMPSINKKAIEYAIKLGLACNSNITKNNFFARKNYFYPDLPKGYQITQHIAPICYNGYIAIDIDEKVEKQIGLTRIHIEEDTGKSLHNMVPNKTLLDFNRAGAPLLEIVTEPTLSTSKEAYLLLHEVRKLVRYLEISDGDMEKGSLRCDANISIMKCEEKVFGTKVEVKNMNSIKNVQSAIEYEIQRQILDIENKVKIIPETRYFDAEKNKTIRMRTKETLSDYRYFIEPDLSPIEITNDYIEKIKKCLPTLPKEYKRKFESQYKIPKYDAKILSGDKELAIYFEMLCAKVKNYKVAANWVIGPIKSHLNELKIRIKDLQIPIDTIAEIINLIDTNKINFSIASQKIFPILLQKPDEIISRLLDKLNLSQIQNKSKIEEWVDLVLKENQEKVKLYKEGKKGLFGMFMGEIMKKSQGKADPRLTSEVLKDKLND